MKNFLSSLFNPKNDPQPEPFKYMNPNRILFSTPTLSDEIAPLEPLKVKPGNKDFAFHEDEWTQIEFFSKVQLEIIQQLLKEYKQFEMAHRANGGWNEVYMRKIPRIPVLSAPDPIAKLEGLLGIRANPGPILYYSGGISGRVKNGFSIPLGGNITLYGYVDNQDIPVMGANVGKNPEDFRLSEAFMKLHVSNQLLLVDWRGQMLMKDVKDVNKAPQIAVWYP